MLVHEPIVGHLTNQDWLGRNDVGSAQVQTPNILLIYPQARWAKVNGMSYNPKISHLEVFVPSLWLGWNTATHSIIHGLNWYTGCPCRSHILIYRQNSRGNIALGGGGYIIYFDLGVFLIGSTVYVDCPLLAILTRGAPACVESLKKHCGYPEGESRGVKDRRMSFGFCRNLLQLVSDYKGFLR